MPPDASIIRSYPMTFSDYDQCADANTFADYVAQQDARNTIELNVRKYTLMLCNALEDNFKSRNKGTIGGKYEAPTYKFVIESGRKYHKIVMEVPNENRSLP